MQGLGWDSLPASVSGGGGEGCGTVYQRLCQVVVEVGVGQSQRLCQWDSLPASVSGGCASVSGGWWWRLVWTVYQRLCQVVVQGLGWDSLPASVSGGGGGLPHTSLALVYHGGAWFGTMVRTWACKAAVGVCVGSNPLADS